MEIEEKLKRKKFRINLPLDVIVDYYKNGITPKEIAKKFGVADDTIRRRLYSMEIPIRSSSEAAKLAFRTGKRPRRITNWKGGRVNSGGYILLKLHGHPRAKKDGYVFEHIVIWEQTHNKPLPPGWVIHHLNGIGIDNRPENLVAMPRAGHQRRELGDLYKRRIRELEAKVRLLERTLDSQQMIWWGEN